MYDKTSVWIAENGFDAHEGYDNSIEEHSGLKLYLRRYFIVHDNQSLDQEGGS